VWFSSLKTPYIYFTIIQNFCENNHKNEYTISMNIRLRVLPLLVVATLASCAPATSERSNKSAVNEYEIREDRKIDWLVILKQQVPYYLVFFYSDYCLHCHQIMGDVLEFSLENIVPTYFVNTQETSVKIPIGNDTEKTIGVNDIAALFIAGTPSIIAVENGFVTANISGSDDCLSFLNEQRLSHK